MRQFLKKRKTRLPVVHQQLFDDHGAALGGGGAAPLMLDNLSSEGMAACVGAWSFRRLTNTYSGPLIRVRRSSDNGEQDFGSGQAAVNVAEVAAFIGGGTGFITTVYAQVGSANLVQATATNQPAWNASAINSLPAADFDGNDNYLTAHGIAAAFSGDSTPLSAIAVSLPDAIDLTRTVLGFGRSSTNTPAFMIDTASSSWRVFSRNDANSSVALSYPAAAAGTGVIHALRYAGATSGDMRIGGSIPSVSDRSNYGTGARTVDQFSVGALVRLAAGSFFDGKMPEWFMFSATLSNADIALLLSDISTYYAIPIPVEATLTAVSSQQVPDAQGGTVGEGFTCTGLAYDPDDNAFWCSNDGRADATDVTFEPSLVKINLAGTVKLDELNIALLFPLAQTLQGVAYDTTNDTLWFASTAENLIRHVSKLGIDQLDSIAVTGVNGVCYDSQRDRLWCTDSSSNLLRKTKAGATEATIATGITNLDQLFYDAANDLIWISSGSNGVAGTVRSFDPDTNAFGGAVYTLTQATAIEGVVILSGDLYLLNDAFFHAVAPNVNELQRYGL